MILMATLAVCAVFGGADVHLGYIILAAIYDFIIAGSIGSTYNVTKGGDVSL